MTKALLIFFALFAIGIQTTNGQTVIVNPKSNAITAKKIVGSDLLIPIELNFVNSTANTLTPSVSIQIVPPTALDASQFSSADIANVKIINVNQNLSINANETKKAFDAFYLFIDKSLLVTNEKIINLKLMQGGNEISKVKVTIQPDDNVLSIGDYIDNNMLDEVTKVESKDNILTVSGYKEVLGSDVFMKKNVELKKGEVLAVYEWNWLLNTTSISLTTVPFKVRPKIKYNEKEFSSSASSGITNLGFNFDLAKRQLDRYFATGKKSTHKVSLGLWGAPSVEELDSVFTNGANGALGKARGKLEKSKQLFISAGLTLSYTYNDISFVFVPIGYDFATSTIGKSWIYNKKRWWGFGIAVSPKIFETMLNK